MIFCGSKILMDIYFYPFLSFDHGLDRVMKELRLCDCNCFSWPINCLDDYATTWNLTEAAGIFCLYKQK